MIGSSYSYAEVVASLIPVVKLAVDEDLRDGDLCVSAIPKQRTKAEIITREDCIYCGSVWLHALANFFNFEILESLQDGAPCQASQRLMIIAARLDELLSFERILLNGLQILCATATQTNRLALLIKDYSCQLLDTRKTIPGFRLAQKYAVVKGGGMNHRVGLYDAIMLKENHQQHSLSLPSQVELVRRQHAGKAIIIEVESIAEMQQAMKLQPEQILLDNFAIADLRAAVQLQPRPSAIKLEASGSITEHNITAVAATGVDYVSMGTITKDIRAIDLSLRVKQ